MLSASRTYEVTVGRRRRKTSVTLTAVRDVDFSDPRIGGPGAEVVGGWGVRVDTCESDSITIG